MKKIFLAAAVLLALSACKESTTSLQGKTCIQKCEKQCCDYKGKGHGKHHKADSPKGHLHDHHKMNHRGKHQDHAQPHDADILEGKACDPAKKCDRCKK